MRGIVTLPHIEVDGADVSIPSHTLSPAFLRRSAVYWDRIDIPRNTLFNAPIAQTPEVSELVSAGVLTETMLAVRVSGEFTMGGVLVGSQFALFEMNERKEPGCWAVAQDASELVVSPDLQQAATAEVELYNLLPVPGDGVPIAKVLEFKRKRQAELDRLRAEMDRLCEEIGTAQKPPRVRNTAIDQVHTAVADVFRTMQEDFAAKVAGKMSIGISLGTVASLVAAAFDIPMPPLVGAAAAAFSFKIREARAPKNLVRKGPFAYVHDLMRDMV